MLIGQGTTRRRMQLRQVLRQRHAHEPKLWKQKRMTVLPLKNSGKHYFSGKDYFAKKPTRKNEQTSAAVVKTEAPVAK